MALGDVTSEQGFEGSVGVWWPAKAWQQVFGAAGALSLIMASDHE